MSKENTQTARQKFQIRTRSRSVRDGEGFYRYNAYATVGGIEREIVCEALSDTLDAEINEWVEAQLDGEVSISK